MQNLGTNTQTPKDQKPHTAAQRIKDSTSEILGDITAKLHGSNDNSNSFLDADTFKNYEKYIGQNVQLPLGRISLIDNVRSSIDTEDDDFKKLQADISKNGIQQNIIVELIKSEQGGQLICVAGHRRVTAALLAGNITHVPALIKQFKNRGDRTHSALAENLLRKDLHCLDIADGYQRLLEEGWGKEDLIEIFDRNETTVRRYLKMANWPKEAKELIRSNAVKFPARILTNKFAARKFSTDMALLQALKSLTDDKVSSVSSKKANLKERLETELESKKIDPKTRDIIRDVFTSLGLIPHS
jgi:ParB/RepB/Spo0J family partition protein